MHSLSIHPKGRELVAVLGSQGCLTNFIKSPEELCGIAQMIFEVSGHTIEETYNNIQLKRGADAKTYNRVVARRNIQRYWDDFKFFWNATKFAELRAADTKYDDRIPYKFSDT